MTADLGPTERHAYGAWLQSEREALGWSRNKLHSEANVDRKHIKDIEEGRANPGGRLRERIRLALQKGRLGEQPGAEAQPLESGVSRGLGPTERHAYGAWLQSEREALGWSRRKLHTEAGVDIAQLANIEEGRVNPGGRLRERIRLALQKGRLGEQPGAEAQPLESGVSRGLGPTERHAYGAWLQSEREALGWSRNKLHYETGVDTGHIKNIEEGQVTPREGVRERIRLALRAGRLESTLDLGPAEQAEYGTWLEGRLAESGLSKQQLYAKASLRSYALAAIISGSRNPRHDIRVRIAEALQNVRRPEQSGVALDLGPADPSEYRDWLKGWRHTLGLSHSELARAAGVHVTHLSRVEKGTVNAGYRSFRPSVFAALERLKLERGWLPAEGAEGRAVSGQASR
ncbi:hypothetical protein AB0C83_43060, partial [Streptomyces sp. NPDC048663]